MKIMFSFSFNATKSWPIETNHMGVETFLLSIVQGRYQTSIARWTTRHGNPLPPNNKGACLRQCFECHEGNLRQVLRLKALTFTAMSLDKPINWSCISMFFLHSKNRCRLDMHSKDVVTLYYRIQLNKVVRKVPRVYTCTFLAPKGRQFQDPKDTFICQGMFRVYGGIVAKSILLIWEKHEKFGSPLKRPGESIGQCCVHICTWRYIYIYIYTPSELWYDVRERPAVDS